MSKKADAVYNDLLKRQEQADIKFQPFEFKLDGHLSVEKTESTIYLHHFFHYFAGVVETKAPAITELPASLFKDDLILQKFAALVNRILTQMLPDALHQEAVLFLNDAVHFALDHLEIDRMDLRRQVNAHVRETRRDVTKRMGIQRRGKKAHWSRFELARAVQNTLAQIPKAEQTQAKCAELMRKKYGVRIPDTAEGFRKLLERSDLSWRKIKTGRIF